jgi:hypothetical protein
VAAVRWNGPERGPRFDAQFFVIERSAFGHFAECSPVPSLVCAKRWRLSRAHQATSTAVTLARAATTVRSPKKESGVHQVAHPAFPLLQIGWLENPPLSFD